MQKKSLQIKGSKYLSFAALFSALVLAACTQNLAQLRKEAPQARTFSSSLASEYLDYANAEAEEKHYSKAEYYAAKGLKALKGEAVPPEAVADQPFTPSQKLKFEQARKNLLELINDNTRSVVPQKAARAQLLYDCWVEQTKEKLPKEEMTCRSEFKQTVKDLKDSPGAAEHLIPHFEVFFDMGSAELTPETKDTLRKVARVTKNLKQCSIELSGHTDRVGPMKTNVKLAEARVAAVQEKLMKHSVCNNNITVLALGESSPRVQAPQGVAEQQNRRVDIDIRGNEK